MLEQFSLPVRQAVYSNMLSASSGWPLHQATRLNRTADSIGRIQLLRPTAIVKLGWKCIPAYRSRRHVYRCYSHWSQWSRLLGLRHPTATHKVSPVPLGIYTKALCSRINITIVVDNFYHFELTKMANSLEIDPHWRYYNTSADGLFSVCSSCPFKPYVSLCLPVTDTVGEAQTVDVRRIVFSTTSHDQGWSDNADTAGTYSDSYSMHDAHALEPSGHHRIWLTKIQGNVHASDEFKEHVNRWDFAIMVPTQDGWHRSGVETEYKLYRKFSFRDGPTLSRRPVLRFGLRSSSLRCYTYQPPYKARTLSIDDYIIQIKKYDLWLSSQHARFMIRSSSICIIHALMVISVI
jgi:hypothetical protein